MQNNKKQQPAETAAPTLQEKRVRYLAQLLGISQGNNMTRVYSAMMPLDFAKKK